MKAGSLFSGCGVDRKEDHGRNEKRRVGGDVLDWQVIQGDAAVVLPGMEPGAGCVRGGVR